MELFTKHDITFKIDGEYYTIDDEIFIKGVPIVDSEMFKTLSDMNVADQSVSDYSNSLHNVLKNKGRVEATRKVLTIFRINPLVAVRMIENCALIEETKLFSYYTMHVLFSAVKNEDHTDYRGVLINKNKVPYVTLLIEASYQQSMQCCYWNPGDFLKYALKEDEKLHNNHKKVKYLNAYNIRHIIKHIPENRQIEFINWFWDRHCYAVLNYGKTETFSSRRVKVMINELHEGSLWQHLENVIVSELSEKERERVEKERNEIKKFISSVVSEGRHTQYVRIVIGKDNFYEKLRALMGDGFVTEYDRKVENNR